MRISALPVYYGWLVLAASACCELLVMGATAYAAGLFVLPIQAEFHITRTAANSSIIILYLGAAVVAPFIGRILDRGSIRRVVCLSAIIFGVALATIALSSSLLVMAVMLFLPAAVGFAATGPLMTQTLVTRWFNRNRGLALGIAAVATSGGGFVVVPLLSEAIQRYGWRQGLLLEAVIIAGILILLSLAVLRDRPSDVGLGDHPENQGGAGATGDSHVAISWRSFFSSSAFWVPALTLSTISGTSQATVITLVPYGIQTGLAPTSAALLISVFAVAAGITKVTAGLLADRINQHGLLIVAALCMTLSWLGLYLSQAYSVLFTAAALAGMGLGCALPTAAGLIAMHFGAMRFGAIMGWAYAFTAILAIVAVLFVGAVFDATRSYRPAFESFSVVLACILGATLVFARSAKGMRT